MDDLCYDCDGTGIRDLLSGARCWTCDGTGWVERNEPDYEDEDFDEEQEAEWTRGFAE
jgi:hypothetical protein